MVLAQRLVSEPDRFSLTCTRTQKNTFRIKGVWFTRLFRGSLLSTKCMLLWSHMMTQVSLCVYLFPTLKTTLSNTHPSNWSACNCWTAGIYCGAEDSRTRNETRNCTSGPWYNYRDHTWSKPQESSNILQMHNYSDEWATNMIVYQCCFSLGLPHKKWVKQV